MKNLYLGVVNVLIFFFVTDLFGSILKVGGGGFYERLIYSIVFAILMYIGPHILLFLKISISDLMEFLINAILSSLFFFLGCYFFNFIEISSSIFDSKIPIIQPINFVDKSIALFAIGALAAGLSVGIQTLNKKKRKSLSSY